MSDKDVVFIGEPGTVVYVFQDPRCAPWVAGEIPDSGMLALDFDLLVYFEEGKEIVVKTFDSYDDATRYTLGSRYEYLLVNSFSITCYGEIRLDVSGGDTFDEEIDDIDGGWGGMDWFMSGLSVLVAVAAIAIALSGVCGNV